jgi:hypothetical protein
MKTTGRARYIENATTTAQITFIVTATAKPGYSRKPSATKPRPKMNTSSQSISPQDIKIKSDFYSEVILKLSVMVVFCLLINQYNHKA